MEPKQEPEKDKDEVSRGSYIVHQSAIYAQVGLVMLIGVFLLWGMISAIDGQLVMMSHPELTRQIEGLVKEGMASGQSVYEAALSGSGQVMTMLSPHMHWFGVAMVVSLVSFGFLGLLLGRLADDVSWGGLLPLLLLLSGINPAGLNDAEKLGVHLEYDAQLAILSVQIITIHLVAGWVNRRKKKTPTIVG